MKQRCDTTLILGGGLAGLSAAYHAQGPVTVLEQCSKPGGHAITHRQAGHTFDLTGHWLHLRNPETLAWIRALDPGVQWHPIARNAELYSQGRHIPYPFQTNLHALSPEDRAHCLATLPDSVPLVSQAQDFESYLLERFGQGITDLFFRPYNEKLWGMALSALSPDCMARFLPQPELAQIRQGALGPLPVPQGYNSCFYYPEPGGIDHLARALSAEIQKGPGKQIRCGERVLSIDLEAKLVRTQGSAGVSSWPFERLISTIALPELVRLVADKPAPVTQSAQRLAWSSWRYLDLGISRPGPRPRHWVYVPDPEIAFFRVGCSSHACPNMAPPGQASLCVELADRVGPIDMDGVLKDLVKLGMMQDPSDLKFVHERRIEYAYVHFDRHYAQARSRIFDWLGEGGVQSIGRYGGWTYGSMEDSLDAGKAAVKAGLCA